MAPYALNVVKSQVMWKKTPLKNAVYASFTINTISLALILGLKNFLPPVVPLFYGLPSGSEQLSKTLGLIILPLASLVITVVNLILAGMVKDVFLKKTLVIAGTFVSVLSAITVVKIMLLVGFF